MNLSCEISEGVLAVTARGRFGVDELRRAVEAAVRGRGGPIPLLLDDRASELLPTLLDVERLAAALRPHQDRLGGRMALVVADGLDLSLARRVAALGARRGWRLGLFTDPLEARGWCVTGLGRRRGDGEASLEA